VVVAAELPGCLSALRLPLLILGRFSVKPDLEKGWRKLLRCGSLVHGVVASSLPAASAAILHDQSRVDKKTYGVS